MVVVDNASEDGSWREVPPDLLIRNAENVGFSRAVNQGVRYLPQHFDHVLLLNPDAWLDPGAVDTLSKAMSDHPRAGAAGPLLVYEDGTRIESGRPFPGALKKVSMALGLPATLPPGLRRRVFQGRFLPGDGPPVVVDWLFGACIMIRHRAWEEVGPLSEEFFLYGEELDWAWRAARHGWQCLYVPQARGGHEGGSSAQKVFSPEEINSRTLEGLRKAAERNLPHLRYRAWWLVQRKLGWRGGPRVPPKTGVAG